MRTAALALLRHTWLRYLNRRYYQYGGAYSEKQGMSDEDERGIVRKRLPSTDLLDMNGLIAASTVQITNFRPLLHLALLE
eukprot:6181943-Pleurochrysis_carterae.AAC.1